MPEQPLPPAPGSPAALRAYDEAVFQTARAITRAKWQAIVWYEWLPATLGPQRFAALPGVISTEVGYTGGTTPQPSYEQVCSHTTGHAEAVRLEYDPQRISYEELLAAFFGMHDPTQLNRQGPDVGDQYRSVIFFHTPEQEAKAIRSKKALEAGGSLRRPVATLIQPAPTFWRAEDYHQRYLEKNSGAACSLGHAGGGR